MHSLESGTAVKIGGGYHVVCRRFGRTCRAIPVYSSKSIRLTDDDAVFVAFSIRRLSRFHRHKIRVC